MRIVLVGPAFPYRGGIANFVAATYRHLQNHGHAVAIVNFTRQYPDFLFPGKTQFEASPQNLPSVRVIDSVWPPSWLQAARAVRQFSPDLIVYNYWMPFFAPAYGTMALFLRRHKTSRQICVCHNVQPHESRPGDRLLNHFFLRQMDGHVVLSRAVEEELLNLEPKARVTRVLHPVDESFPQTEPKEAARKRLGLPPEKTVLLFFGYIRRYKGLDILLHALPLVRRHHPDVFLLIVGEFYEPRAPFEALIREKGLEEVVRIVDRFVPNTEVGLYFSAADGVVMPYRSATQSGILPIAYQFEKPVITTRVGGLPDFVEEGKTGFLVKPEDPEALAAAIETFLEKRKSISFEENIRRFREKFSWENLVEAIESFSQKSKAAERNAVPDQRPEKTDHFPKDFSQK